MHFPLASWAGSDGFFLKENAQLLKNFIFLVEPVAVASTCNGRRGTLASGAAPAVGALQGDLEPAWAPRGFLVVGVIGGARSGVGGKGLEPCAPAPSSAPSLRSSLTLRRPTADSPAGGICERPCTEAGTEAWVKVPTRAVRSGVLPLSPALSFSATPQLLVWVRALGPRARQGWGTDRQRCAQPPGPAVTLGLGVGRGVGRVRSGLSSLGSMGEEPLLCPGLQAGSTRGSSQSPSKQQGAGRTRASSWHGGDAPPDRGRSPVTSWRPWGCCRLATPTGTLCLEGSLEALLFDLSFPRGGSPAPGLFLARLSWPKPGAQVRWLGLRLATRLPLTCLRRCRVAAHAWGSEAWTAGQLSSSDLRGKESGVPLLSCRR